MLNSKNIIIAGFLGCLIISESFTSFSCQEGRRQPNRYLIPKDYIGWVRVDYNVKGAPALPVEDGRYLIKFPPTGYLQTSSSKEYGWGKDEFYYYSDDARYSLESTISGGGGKIWGAFNGNTFKNDERVIFEYLFVGGEEEYKKNVLTNKDESLPKPGCIKDSNTTKPASPTTISAAPELTATPSTPKRATQRPR